MKNSSNATRKAELIKAFAETLDKHCESDQDAWCVLVAFMDFCKFFEGQRERYPYDLSCQIRTVREKLTEDDVRLYDDLSDDCLSSIMISASNAEGLLVYNSMREDLVNLVC